METDLSIAPRASPIPLDRHPLTMYLAPLAPASVASQRQALAAVVREVCPDATLETFPWERLRYPHVMVILQRMRARKLGPATINRTLCAIRRMASECKKLGLLSSDDLQGIREVKNLKVGRELRGRNLSDDELRKLWDACDRSTPAGARDAALLALVYAAGLRRFEVGGLTMARVDRSAGRVKVLGKRGKDLYVQIRPGVFDAMEPWLAFRGKAPGPLLLRVSQTGTVQRQGISGQAVYAILRDLSERTGVPFTPHDLRRTFVSNLLDDAQDMPATQALARHDDANTTSKYDRRGERAATAAAGKLRLPWETG